MNFVANEVFQDNEVNVIHNQILRLEPTLAITGTVGRILKNDVPMQDIYVSALASVVPDKFNGIASKIEQEFGMDLYSSRRAGLTLQFIIKGHYIEIWNFPDTDTEMINGMRVQSTIPNSIL